MGVLTVIKGLFKGGVSVDKVFTTAAKGMDELKLTEQERADSLRDFVKDTLSENSQRSKARRIISIVLVVNFIIAFWLGIVCYFAAPQAVEVIIEIIKAFKMDVAFLAIIGFFFGGYYLGKFGNKGKGTK
jgi:hypothetical protein